MVVAQTATQVVAVVQVLDLSLDLALALALYRVVAWMLDKVVVSVVDQMAVQALVATERYMMMVADSAEKQAVVLMAVRQIALALVALLRVLAIAWARIARAVLAWLAVVAVAWMEVAWVVLA